MLKQWDEGMETESELTFYFLREKEAHGSSSVSGLIHNKSHDSFNFYHLNSLITW